MSKDYGSIGVLMGGRSSEREISLKSGQGVADALRRAGHTVKELDLNTSERPKILDQVAQAGIDVAFIALHGRLGEDGGIQSILEETGIPYTGSGIKASALAFNKIHTQKALKRAGLPVADHFIIEDGGIVEFKMAWAALKSTPVVVKPACEGSSIGVHLVRHPSEWEPALRNALSFGPEVIVEPYIKGREVTAGILQKEALPLVEIISKTGLFDFSAKYQKGVTRHIVPAELDEATTRKVQEIALRAHQVLGCAAFSRVDLRLNESGRPFILEVNTIPGFTEFSLFPKAAAAAGYSFTAVCEKLLDLAYGKERKD